MSKSRDAADQINRVNSSAANATAITINASENVGIGTSSPSTTLQVTGNSSSRNTIVSNVALDGGTSVANPYEGFGFGINFIGRDYGNAVRNYASINTVTEAKSSSSGGGDAGFKTGLSFYTNGGGASGTNPTEAMRISGGNVGIGTSSPNHELDVKAATNSGISITPATGNATNYLDWYDTGGGPYGRIGYNHQTSAMTFSTLNNERMRIDSSGAVTMPAQPAFSAINNTAAQTNLAINTYHTVVFGGEVFDQGSDFASNTFTAPVTGRYQFNVQIRLYQIDTAAEYYQAYITTSNRGYEVGLVSPLFTSDPTYMTLSSSFLVDMDAADTAYVRFYQAGGSAQTDLQQACSIFSGYLVA